MIFFILITKLTRSTVKALVFYSHNYIQTTHLILSHLFDSTFNFYIDRQSLFKLIFKWHNWIGRINFFESNKLKIYIFENIINLLKCEKRNGDNTLWSVRFLTEKARQHFFESWKLLSISAYLKPLLVFLCVFKPFWRVGQEFSMKQYLQHDKLSKGLTKNF